jgi:hypothetical protein
MALCGSSSPSRPVLSSGSTSAGDTCGDGGARCQKRCRVERRRHLWCGNGALYRVERRKHLCWRLSAVSCQAPGAPMVAVEAPLARLLDLAFAAGDHHGLPRARVLHGRGKGVGCPVARPLEFENPHRVARRRQPSRDLVEVEVLRPRRVHSTRVAAVMRDGFPAAVRAPSWPPWSALVLSNPPVPP